MKMMNEPQPRPADDSDSQRVVYYMPPPGHGPDDDEINLLDYWRVMVQNKWLILATAVLATGLSVAAALLMTPVYRAEVVMAPAAEDKGGGLSALAGQFGGLASMAGLDIGGGGGKTEEALATLESRAFTESFIQDENLMPVLFAEHWDAANGRWVVENPEDKPTAWDAYEVFAGIRSVNEDKQSGMVTLAVEWTDAEQAAAWANSLVERLNAHQRQEAIGEAEKSIAYLKQQLAQTNIVELQQSIYRLIEAQTKNIMLANVRDQYAFKVIDPAVVPEERIKPKRQLMVVLGLMVGLMLGIFLAFFRSFIKNQRDAGRAEEPRLREIHDQ